MQNGRANEQWNEGMNRQRRENEELFSLTPSFPRSFILSFFHSPAQSLHQKITQPLKMNPDSKIYIAGHNGLVGSAILRTLKAKGYRNFVTRSFEDLDLRDAQAVKTFFEQEKPEYVFLAAARVGGIMANNTYRAEFIYDNLMIQNHVIHQSYLSKVKKLLFLGSTCIYPRECPQPMPEDALLTAPLEYTNEPYAIAKIAGIKMCESYNLQYGTDFLAVMPTNLYGPHDNFDLEKSHVLPALIRKIHLGKCMEEGNWEAVKKDLRQRPLKEMAQEKDNLENKKIITLLSAHGIVYNAQEVPSVTINLWGTGKPLREFLWVEDMAEACVFVMESINFSQLSSQKEEIRNTHLNIGTGKEISIRELAEQIAHTIGFGGRLQFDTNKPDGTQRKLTNPSKINQLGWKHKVEINEGIQRVYDWYRNT